METLVSSYTVYYSTCAYEGHLCITETLTCTKCPLLYRGCTITLFFCLASLSVAGGANFDYESDKTVDITLVASDSVNPPHRMSSNVTITVNVLDDNDIVPSFKLSSYSVSIYEDIPVDSVLTGVDIEAEDEDTGLGGVIEYSIVSSVPILSQQDFSINSTNGKCKVFENQLIWYKSKSASVTLCS